MQLRQGVSRRAGDNINHTSEVVNSKSNNDVNFPRS